MKREHVSARRDKKNLEKKSSRMQLSNDMMAKVVHSKDVVSLEFDGLIAHCHEDVIVIDTEVYKDIIRPVYNSIEIGSEIKFGHPVLGNIGNMYVFLINDNFIYLGDTAKKSELRAVGQRLAAINAISEYSDDDMRKVQYYSDYTRTPIKYLHLLAMPAILSIHVPDDFKFDKIKLMADLESSINAIKKESKKFNLGIIKVDGSTLNATLLKDSKNCSISKKQYPISSTNKTGKENRVAFFIKNNNKEFKLKRNTHILMADSESSIVFRIDDSRDTPSLIKEMSLPAGSAENLDITDIIRKFEIKPRKVAIIESGMLIKRLCAMDVIPKFLMSFNRIYLNLDIDTDGSITIRLRIYESGQSMNLWKSGIRFIGIKSDEVNEEHIRVLEHVLRTRPNALYDALTQNSPAPTTTIVKKSRKPRQPKAKI